MQQGTFLKGYVKIFGFEIIGGNTQTFHQKSKDVLNMQDKRLGKRKTKKTTIPSQKPSQIIQLGCFRIIETSNGDKN